MNESKYTGSAASLAHSIEKLTKLEWEKLDLPPINLWSFPAAWKATTITAHDLLIAVAVVLQQKPPGWQSGIEDVAKMLEKKADNYATENGHDDMGALSFGQGHRGREMAEYHSNLLELAEDVRKMLPTSDQPNMKRIDWNEISERGLLVRINREIMHPLGLSVYRDPATGVSSGAMVSPDGKWEYKDDQQPKHPHAQLLKFYNVTTTNELIAAQEKHIEKLQAKASPHSAHLTEQDHDAFANKVIAVNNEAQQIKDAKINTLLVAVRAVVREALDNVRVHPCDTNNDAVHAVQLPDNLLNLYIALRDVET